MTIEQEVLKRKKLDPKKLSAFGFEKKGERYFLSVPFSDGEFRADIIVSAQGTLTGKVVDLTSEEEYLPLRTEMKGAFVSAVREGYKEVLTKIADACYYDVPFLFAQSNRIAEKVNVKYGEKPDYPFDTDPDFGVFRFPENQKWYAIIMNIKKSVLTGKAEDKDNIVEVMNVKIDPEEREKLLRTEGVYICYHMNKQKWVTLLLDDTLSDESVIELMDKSRSLIMTSSKRSR